MSATPSPLPVPYATGFDFRPRFNCRDHLIAGTRVEHPIPPIKLSHFFMPRETRRWNGGGDWKRGWWWRLKEEEKRIEPPGWDPTLRVDWIPRVTIDSRRQRDLVGERDCSAKFAALPPFSLITHPFPISSLLPLFLPRVRFSRCSRDFFVVSYKRDKFRVLVSKRVEVKKVLFATQNSLTINLPPPSPPIHNRNNIGRIINPYRKRSTQASGDPWKDTGGHPSWP